MRAVSAADFTRDEVGLTAAGGGGGGARGCRRRGEQRSVYQSCANLVRQS